MLNRCCFYTTTCASPRYFTTKATEYYTTSYAATTYYIEATKFTLCWVTTPLRKPNITPQTLPQLTTWKFLNARSEISIWFYLDMSVAFMVIGHWELIVYLDWENKISNAGNSFVKLGKLQTCQRCGRCLLVRLLQGQYPTLWYVCYVLEVITA
jgi:hypothetical protein